MALIIESVVAATANYSIYVFLALVVIYITRKYYNNGLNKYPGPFWASLTDLWRFMDVSQRRPDITHVSLHRKYGDIVRLGPNTLSFANPAAIKTIYGLHKGFVKSEFYPVQMTTSKGEPLPSLFSTLDESFHANLRRSVSNAFSMTSVVQYEPMVDETAQLFLDQTAKLYASSGQVCDFARWLQFFAFDVIGSITYSKRHGFIDKNEDIEGIVKSLSRIFDYSGPVGQMPWLDKVFWKNPLFDLLQKFGLMDNSHPVAVFARQRMKERMTTADAATKPSVKPGNRDDLLTMFLKAREARPDFMTEKRVLTMAVSMAFAGSETTAISIAAVFYYLLKNSSCMARVQTEIDDAVLAGKIENRPTGLVTWAESQELPYLDACIKEAFRLHPAAGLPLERIVPPSGIEINGEFIPGGTIVGCNAWVIHRREEVFGPDVDTYNPDRWLTTTEDALKKMNSTMFQFGAGSRTCIGKNVSLMEIYKTVPSFLRRFDVQLANPNEEWQLWNAWFVRQHNFKTTFKEKEIRL